jgi:hypothetical protein
MTCIFIWQRRKLLVCQLISEIPYSNDQLGDKWSRGMSGCVVLSSLLIPANLQSTCLLAFQFLKWFLLHMWTKCLYTETIILYSNCTDISEAKMIFCGQVCISYSHMISIVHRFRLKTLLLNLSSMQEVKKSDAGLSEPLSNVMHVSWLMNLTHLSNSLF